MHSYYNFIRQAEDLYEVMDIVDSKYDNTLRTMIDEVIFHFMDMHKVPYDRQGEFLQVMFPDCPRIVEEYKTKKFNM